MALPTSEVKFDTNLISHIPILTGQDNYNIWQLQIQTTLFAYFMWEFVDGTLTYTAQADTADRLKWKLLDKQVLGLMASTINDSLLTHVNYEWADLVVCPSIRRLSGIASKDSLGQSDSLDSSICSTRLSDSTSILLTPTHRSTTIMSNSRHSLSLDSTSPKPYTL